MFRERGINGLSEKDIRGVSQDVLGEYVFPNGTAGNVTIAEVLSTVFVAMKTRIPDKVTDTICNNLSPQSGRGIRDSINAWNNWFRLVPQIDDQLSTINYGIISNAIALVGAQYRDDFDLKLSRLRDAGHTALSELVLGGILDE